MNFNNELFTEKAETLTVDFGNNLYLEITELLKDKANYTWFSFRFDAMLPLYLDFLGEVFKNSSCWYALHHLCENLIDTPMALPDTTHTPNLFDNMVGHLKPEIKLIVYRARYLAEKLLLLSDADYETDENETFVFSYDLRKPNETEIETMVKQVRKEAA